MGANDGQKDVNIIFFFFFMRHRWILLGMLLMYLIYLVYHVFDGVTMSLKEHLGFQSPAND